MMMPMALSEQQNRSNRIPRVVGFMKIYFEKSLAVILLQKDLYGVFSAIVVGLTKK